MKTSRFRFIIAASGFMLAVLTFGSSTGDGRPSQKAVSSPPRFAVALPEKELPFPTPLPAGQDEPEFELRGTKGWAWTWDQYLAEIPTLVLGRMNFLMSCYTSVFTDTEKFVNRWREPFSETTKAGLAKVAEACRRNGIAFCFSFHPALFTDRPLRVENAQDFEDLWQHFAWVQSLGVRWFSLSYDDIDTAGRDPAAMGASHAGLANRLLERLRAKDGSARLIFCPVYYWGCGDKDPANAYLRALGSALDKDAFLFWTGDDVVTPQITRACAEKYRGIVGHRLIIWDNYPVNDRSGALHLGPVSGRDPDLAEIASGYMSNPHCPQNEINRIPLLTCADYAYNPRSYDPSRSIGQAILRLADKAGQRRTLQRLVELYPGNLLSGSASTAYHCTRETFLSLLREPEARAKCASLIAEVDEAAAGLFREFPGRYAETKKTLAAHAVQLQDLFREHFPGERAAAGSAGTVSWTRDRLFDKVKGGWAGQTIGCTYGGPTEFRYKGSFMRDDQPIPWSEGAIINMFKNSPGLYDDVYMDLTFVDILEKRGLDAPASAFARAFAEAPYPLWHANQMARYNILHGLEPPASGHWRNNPHADDIDFQIEADFAGLMSPGLPRAAASLCDRVGRIMNDGDGLYGGLYIATLYALAFVSDDIPGIAEEALRAIPAESAFAGTMRDVLAGWREHPADWRMTWFEIQKKWGGDVGCPDGVFSPFDIDAKINAAWVLLGLLYGGGDFGRTIDIAARAGDDSDCNPASAGGILGTILGYDRIPERWKKGLQAAEDIPFPYVGMSLRRAVELSFKHALANVEKNGGRLDGDKVTAAVQAPETQPLEVCFAGHIPVERRSLGRDLAGETSLEFEGIGFALGGEARAKDSSRHRFQVEVRVDGILTETADLPTDDHIRRETLFWKYGLTPGRHVVKLKVLNPRANASIQLGDLVVYADKARPH